MTLNLEAIMTTTAQRIARTVAESSDLSPAGALSIAFEALERALTTPGQKADPDLRRAHECVGRAILRRYDAFERRARERRHAAAN